jgi:hypothetical protein
VTVSHRERIGNWRLDSVGRLVQRYATNDRLNKCWQAAFDAGIPEEERQPWGASNPLADVPTDGLFSEHVLRAFEAYRGRGADEYPESGFRSDLKGIARNLETACRIAVEGFGVQSVTQALIPLDWLATAAEFTWYRSAPGVADPRLAISKDLQPENGPYPYLGVLWLAWGLAPKASDFVYGDGSEW